MKHLAIKALVFVLLTAAAAQAGITTANVKVLVTGKRCSELKAVYLVINGKDLEDRWVKLDPDGNCRWKADLGDGTISTSVARFSLRADLARSGCQMAKPIETATELIASLEFSCCAEGASRNVRVRIEPPMPVSYARIVRPFAGDRIPGVPCIETATLARGQGSIGNALFDGEDVYLNFEAFDPKRQTVGLFLNSIVVDDGTLVLTRDGVTYRLIVQRAKGKARSAPTLSSNAITLDIKKLSDLKFERAEFEVIK